MGREEVAALKAGLLDRARAVTGASEGFLGWGPKVLAAEAGAIRRFEQAFAAGGRRKTP